MFSVKQGNSEVVINSINIPCELVLKEENDKIKFVRVVFPCPPLVRTYNPTPKAPFSAVRIKDIDPDCRNQRVLATQALFRLAVSRTKEAKGTSVSEVIKELNEYLVLKYAPLHIVITLSK